MTLSKLDIAKHKGEVLDLIMNHKRVEVPKQMELVSLAQVKAFAQLAPPALDLAAALTAHKGASLIAEVKRASPSRGLIAQDWDPELIGETYARSGAAAISCLTDSRFFQGELAYLTAIKERLRKSTADWRLVTDDFQKPEVRAENLSPSSHQSPVSSQQASAPFAIPVLRKDFLYHEYQVYEARMAGADAVLLIVGVLSDTELRTLYRLTCAVGMQALVEVHDEAELERALAVDAHIIGVNNRNLRTFEVDIETTARLRRLIPAGKVLVAESGIRTTEDVAHMAEIGCDAILVGETFCKLRQPERAAAVQRFVQAGRLG
jgi:indole-3-glycerol phosphate synthase